MANEIFEIAKSISDQITGIDWAAIQKKTGQSREEDVYGKGEYLVYLVDAYREFNGIRTKLTLSLDQPPTTETAQAYLMAENALSGSYDKFMTALRANAQWMPGTTSFDIEVYRAMVTKMQQAIVNTMSMHLEIFMQKVGDEPLAIANNADNLYRMMKGMKLMWDAGALNPLKKSPSQVPGPVSGLGQPLGIAVGTIVLVSVISALVIAAICFCWYMSSVLDETVRWRDQACKKALESGSEADRKLCIELNDQTNKQLKGEGLALGEALNQAVMILSIGALAYAGFLLLPRMLRAWRKPRHREVYW